MHQFVHITYLVKGSFSIWAYDKFGLHTSNFKLANFAHDISLEVKLL